MQELQEVVWRGVDWKQPGLDLRFRKVINSHSEPMVYRWYIYNSIVNGVRLDHLEKWWSSSMGLGLSHVWNGKNVTNHQADMVCLSLQVFEHREYLGIVSRPGQGSPASTGSWLGKQRNLDINQWVKKPDSSETFDYIWIEHLCTYVVMNISVHLPETTVRFSQLHHFESPLYSYIGRSRPLTFIKSH